MRDFMSRHRLLLGIELLGLIICVLFCFRPEELVFSADADAIAGKMYIEEGGNYYRSDWITLRPGVYRLRMRCEEHEGILYPTVGASESSFQALRCNGVSVLAHRREIDIEAYVVDRVDNAFVLCNYIGRQVSLWRRLNCTGRVRAGGCWRLFSCWRKRQSTC